MKWINDGKPVGIFVRPHGSSRFTGAIFSQRLMLSWVFRKPDWIEKGDKSARIYRLFRLAGFTSFSVLSLFIISFVVIFLVQP
jgi:hypothetical protein